jgi:Family of unknown function (DUF6289)
MVRRLLTATAAVMLVLVGLSPTTAQAWPRCEFGFECWYDWYSDSTRTVLVGTMHVDCDGRQTSEGDHTPYLTFSSWHC